MHNRLKRVLTILVAAVSLQSALPALAAPASPDAAWEKFVSARRVFQTRLADLAARRWPAHRQFFELHRDLQLAYIERRNLVFYELLRSDPARIVRDQGGQRFIGFEWSQTEDAAYAKSIPGYADLAAEIATLRRRSESFKDREVLRDRFARLELDPDYLVLMRDMGRSIEEAERLLADSRTPSSAPPAA